MTVCEILIHLSNSDGQVQKTKLSVQHYQQLSIDTLVSTTSLENIEFMVTLQ